MENGRIAKTAFKFPEQLYFLTKKKKKKKSEIHENIRPRKVEYSLEGLRAFLQRAALPSLDGLSVTRSSLSEAAEGNASRIIDGISLTFLPLLQQIKTNGR